MSLWTYLGMTHEVSIRYISKWITGFSDSNQWKGIPQADQLPTVLLKLHEMLPLTAEIIALVRKKIG